MGLPKCTIPTPLQDDDYYLKLQKQIEVLRPFVWLAFFVKDPGGTLVEKASLFIDRIDDPGEDGGGLYSGMTKGPRFRHMKKFEHKLFSNGGEAVQVVFYDAYGANFNKIIASILMSIHAQPGPFNAKTSTFYLAFQYGWYNETSADNASDNLIFQSNERILVITKCDIAWDEGGMTYTVGGVDIPAALQTIVPRHQFPQNMNILDAFKAMLQYTDPSIKICIGGNLSAIISGAGQNAGSMSNAEIAKFIEKQFTCDGRNLLNLMNHYAAKHSKPQQYVMFIGYESATKVSIAGNGLTATQPWICIDVMKIPDKSEKITLLKGWPKNGMPVNVFEAEGVGKGEGGVVIDFRPMIDYAKITSMLAETQAANSLTRSVNSTSEQATTGGTLKDVKQPESPAGLQANNPSAQVDDNKTNLEYLMAMHENITAKLRTMGSSQFSGMQADLVCLGMPLYDSRELIAQGMGVKLRVFFPMRPQDKVSSGDVQWISNPSGSTWDGNANLCAPMTGTYIIQDIAHRIEVGVGYSTAYSLSFLIAEGRDLKSSVPGNN